MCRAVATKCALRLPDSISIGQATRTKISLIGPKRPAYCQGKPLRNEVEKRDKSLLGKVTDMASAAIEEAHGTGEVSARIQSHIVTVVA